MELSSLYPDYNLQNSVKMKAAAIILCFLSATAYAACPNQCSGHGL